MLKRFSMLDLIIIAMMAALGVAIKPIVVPLAHMITGPLYIPGGTVAGGFYMLWIVLGAALVQKPGAATLVCLVQAIMVVSLGIYGTHGILSFVTYLLPGIGVDLVFTLLRKYRNAVIVFFMAGIVANMAGSYMVNLAFFRLPLVPLILSLSVSALSGGIGGLIAYSIAIKAKLASIL